MSRLGILGHLSQQLRLARGLLGENISRSGGRPQTEVGQDGFQLYSIGAVSAEELLEARELSLVVHEAQELPIAELARHTLVVLAQEDSGESCALRLVVRLQSLEPV